jgi:ADP-ribose pyrophosphatase
VAIVAVSSEDELILVEQYRVPVAKRVIELPAGIVGDESEHSEETTLEAAKRELLEETGYVSEDWSEVFSGCSSAGLSDEFIVLMVARDVKRVGPGGGVDDEKIDVHCVALEELHQHLSARMDAGVMVDLKVWLAREALRLSG